MSRIDGDPAVEAARLVRDTELARIKMARETVINAAVGQYKKRKKEITAAYRKIAVATSNKLIYNDDPEKHRAVSLEYYRKAKAANPDMFRERQKLYSREYRARRTGAQS